MESDYADDDVLKLLLLPPSWLMANQRDCSGVRVQQACARVYNAQTCKSRLYLTLPEQKVALFI